MLLVGAGLFLRSVHNIESIRLGYDVSRIAALGPHYDDWRGIDSASLARAADRVRLVPGVEHVALVGEPPMDGGRWLTKIYTTTDSTLGQCDSQESCDKEPSFIVVSPGFFDVAGVRMLRGRPLTNDLSWSIVVNETMARHFWPHQDAIGQCVRLFVPLNGKFGKSRCYTVVGVAENTHRARVVEQPNSYFYVPAAHPPDKGMRAFQILIRAEPARWGSVVAGARRILIEEFPGGRPLITRMEDQLAPTYRPFRLGAWLFSVFGALALMVAILGVYSTSSYIVSQRTQEFGVRIAVGAQVADVLRLVIGEGLRTVAIGTAIGLVLALASGRLVASLLFDVEATDPLTLVVAVAVLLLAGVVAALAPAWRAARVDPVVSLRAD